tara:strand:- start:237 stop:764 length:528 start_codon:yes stop_codon:yes gene_type:complete
MKNLAGVELCDSDIVRELLEAKIEIIPHDRNHAYEVRSSFHGKLNGWRFTRAWYYWVARPIAERSGLPLSDAIKLHEAHGKDVRVAGHCGAPPPQEWVKRYTTDGREVIHDPEGEQLEFFNRLEQEGSFELKAHKFLFVKDLIEAEYEAVIDCYHIDTQVGLNALANVLRDLADN